MAEFVGGIFSAIFGSHSWLATIIISMFPIIELKGAIPVGMNIEFWGGDALGGTLALLCSLLGSCLVVPILAVVFAPLVKWLKGTKAFRKLGNFIDEKVRKHSATIQEKAQKEEGSSKKKTLIKMLGIFTFVAIPLPLTGVWTGTCVAVAIGLNFWQTVVSVVLGNIVAGLIITFVCAIFPQFTTIIFLIVLAFVLAIVLYTVIKFLMAKKKDSDEDISLEQSDEEDVKDNK